MFGQDRDRYIKGLTWFRDDRVVDWVESFSTATIAAVTIAEQ